ncbi:MAG: phosphotransferase [Proteobacteria bacterium]|nr:phosphotransferase [Pseudomonadota bacterium]
MNFDEVTPQDMRFNPPTFNVADVAEKVAKAYGLRGQWEPLTGERDQNFQLTTEDGRKFVVKIAGPDEDPDVADFQVQALLYLEKGSPQIPVPRIIRTKGGNVLSEISNSKEVKHALRVVTYLDGIPYGRGAFPDAQNLQKIGAFQGGVVKALAGFEHKASRHFMPWNLSNGIAVSRDLWAEAADDVKTLAAPLLHRLRHEVLPKLNAGRSQIIHNDGHPYNLLRADAVSMDVVGLIDFGDMVYAPIINELAVSATTFYRWSNEDLNTVENLLIGFHSKHPLSDTEVSLLWDAMTLRAIITILLSDIKLSMDMGADHDPDVIEERMEGYTTLKIICDLDHKSVVKRLRAACGM